MAEEYTAIRLEGAPGEGWDVLLPDRITVKESLHGTAVEACGASLAVTKMDEFVTIEVKVTVLAAAIDLTTVAEVYLAAEPVPLYRKVRLTSPAKPGPFVSVELVLTDLETGKLIPYQGLNIAFEYGGGGALLRVRAAVLPHSSATNDYLTATDWPLLESLYPPITSLKQSS